MKAEREKQWEQAIGSLIPVRVGHEAEDRRPINRDRGTTDLVGRDPIIKQKVEPLTQRLGSLFKEVGL